MRPQGSAAGVRARRQGCPTLERALLSTRRMSSARPVRRFWADRAQVARRSRQLAGPLGLAACSRHLDLVARRQRFPRAALLPQPAAGAAFLPRPSRLRPWHLFPALWLVRAIVSRDPSHALPLMWLVQWRIAR